MGTLNMHDYQHNTTMSVQFSSSLSQRPIFIFVVADVMSNYLTTDGLKKNFSTSGGPLRPEARGICHICHMVNAALRIPLEILTTQRTSFLPRMDAPARG